jgi:hypothetical protein
MEPLLPSAVKRSMQMEPPVHQLREVMNSWIANFVIPPVTCPPPPWMNGRNRGVTILKNGGASGKFGGKRISNMMELILLSESKDMKK